MSKDVSEFKLISFSYCTYLDVLPALRGRFALRAGGVGGRGAQRAQVRRTAPAQGRR